MANSEGTFTLKISHAGKTRRHVVTEEITYSELIDLVKADFSDVGCNLMVCWCDDEEDTITLSTTEELQEARRVGAAQDGVLRIWCFEPDKFPVPTSLPSVSSDDANSQASGEFVVVTGDSDLEAEASALLADLEGGVKSQTEVSESLSEASSACFVQAEQEFVNLENDAGQLLRESPAKLLPEEDGSDSISTVPSEMESSAAEQTSSIGEEQKSSGSDDAVERQLQEEADLMLAESLEVADIQERAERDEAVAAAAAASDADDAAVSFAGDAVAQLLAGLAAAAPKQGLREAHVSELLEAGVSALGQPLSPPTPAAVAKSPSASDVAPCDCEGEKRTPNAGDDAGIQASPKPGKDAAETIGTTVLRLLSQPAVVAALQTALASDAAREAITQVAAHALVLLEEEGDRSELSGVRIFGVLLPLLPTLLPVLAQLLHDAPALMTDLGPALSRADDLRRLLARLRLAPVKGKADTDNTTVVHTHVTCDGCAAHHVLREKSREAGHTAAAGKYIRGVRFKSVIEKDFDLCATCEADGRYESTHAPFLKINTPAQAPATVFCVLKDDAPARQRSDGAFVAAMDQHAPRRNGEKPGGWRGNRKHQGGGRCGWRRSQRKQWRQVQEACQDTLTQFGAASAAGVGAALKEMSAAAAAAAAAASAAPPSPTTTSAGGDDDDAHDRDLAKAIHESCLAATAAAEKAAAAAQESPPKTAEKSSPPKTAEKSSPPKKQPPMPAVAEVVPCDRPVAASGSADTQRGFLFVSGTAGFVEYVVRVPKTTAAIQVDATLNSKDARPVSLAVDGVVVDTAFGRQTTGSYWDCSKMTKFEQGTYALPPDDDGAALVGTRRPVRLRLSAGEGGFFPHLKSLHVTPLSASDKIPAGVGATAAHVKEPAVPDSDNQRFYGYHARTLCDGCHSRDEAMSKALMPAALAAGCVGPAGTIKGLRYKSRATRDFDVCHSCFSSGRFDAAHSPFDLMAPTSPIVDAAPDEVASSAAAAAPPSKAAAEKTLVIFTRDHVVPEGDARYATHNIKSFPKGAVVVLEKGTLASGLGGIYKDYVQVRSAPTPLGKPGKAGRVSRKVLRLHHNKAQSDAAAVNKQPKQRPCAPPAPARPMARFVKDVSVSDGAVVAPGSKFSKGWRVLNSGTKAWPAGTRVTCVGGDLLGGPESGVLVPACPAGEAVDVFVELTAPAKAGRYVGYWRLVTPGASRFGHRFWVDLRVDDALPTASPTASPTDSSSGLAPGATAAPCLGSGKWALQIQLLQGMGFTDVAKICTALETAGGDLQLAVTSLLE